MLPGSEIVRRAPELLALPPGTLLREARRAAAFGSRPDLRMSRQAELKLEAGWRILERVGYDGLTGRAAAAACVIDIATGRLDEHWRISLRGGFNRGDERPRPRTLGGLAICVRRYARKLRREARAARGVDRG